MKKVLFMVVALALVGWAWYLSQNTEWNSLKKDSFEKAMQIMSNLQSRTIQTDLTEENITTLETAYIEAQERKIKVQTFRDADITKLSNRLAELGVGVSARTEIANMTKQRKDTYLANIWLFIWALSMLTDVQKTEVRTLCNSINSMSTDLQLINNYISWYSEKRPNICMNNGPGFNLYSAGTISFRYRTGTLSDTCQNSNTKVKEVRCEGFIYNPGNISSERTSDCAYGCSAGKCLKWTLWTTIKAVKTTTTTVEETDIDMDEIFYLQIMPARVETSVPGSLSVEISSPSFAPNKCILGVKNQNLVATTATAINFGPITCPSAGNHDFTFTLKEDNQNIGTQIKRISVGTIAMQEFNFIKLNGQDITNTPTVQKNQAFSITVQTMGTNDEPYTTYTKKFYVLVSGDDDRTIPEGGQTMDGSDRKTLSGIKFATTGEVTLSVRSEDNAFEKSIKITVTD